MPPAYSGLSSVSPPRLCNYLKLRVRITVDWNVFMKDKKIMGAYPCQMTHHGAAVFVLLFATGCSLQAAWQAGAAAVDITPKESIWLAGYADRSQPSQSVRQPIHAKALALKDDAGVVSVMVTMDLVGVQRDIAEQVARRAAGELHLPRERLIFNGRTRTAPRSWAISVCMS